VILKFIINPPVSWNAFSLLKGHDFLMMNNNKKIAWSIWKESEGTKNWL
jgi:hypothetical protein